MSNSTMFALVIRLRRGAFAYIQKRKIIVFSVCRHAGSNKSLLSPMACRCDVFTKYFPPPSTIPHHLQNQRGTKFLGTNLRVYPINIPSGNNDETVIQISHSYRVIRAWVQSTSTSASESKRTVEIRGKYVELVKSTSNES